MATWSGTFGSRPTWNYTLTATCTNRTSTQATIKMDLSIGLKIQSSSTKFGYNYYWEPIIGSTSGGWQKLKDASPNWSDGVKRTYSYTATISAAASVTSVTVKFNTKSTQTSGSAYTPAVSKTLTIPTGNTAPVWATNDAHIKLGSVALNQANTIIPENTSSVTVVLPRITDAERNSIKLTTVRYANNSSQGTVNTATVSSGTSHTFTDNISSLGSGTAIKYTASATDGSLSASATRTTWVYTKNTFSKATVSSIGSIKYKTGCSFTVTNGKNQGGQCNNNCSYTLTSLTTGVTLKGTTSKSTSAAGTFNWSLGIDSGDTYLSYSELKSILASSNYKGSIKLRLTSSNSYGSSGYVDFTIKVDLTTTLPSVTNLKYSGGTVTIGSTAYYCPQKSNTMSISFTTVTDPIGANSIKYKVYLEDGHNSIYLGNASVNGTTGSYSIDLKTHIGNINKSNNMVVVEAVTNYGVKSYASGSTFRTYSYADPSLSITSITRTGTTANVSGTFILGTDLPITPNGLTYTITGGSATSYILSGSGRNRTFSISLTGLAEKSYSITVKASDTYVSKSAVGTIPLADPMLALRTYGVGINCIPTKGNILEVKGLSLLRDGFKMTSPDGTYTKQIMKAYNGGQNGLNLTIEGGGNTIIGGGESATNYMGTLATGSTTENLYLTADNTLTFASNCNTITDRKEMTFVNGLLTINTQSAQNTSGIRIVGSSGVQGSIWAGTGGFAIHSTGDYNLHLGRNGSTSDMTFYSDRIETKKDRVAYGSNIHDINAGERRVAFGSGLTRYWGMYGNSNGLGWYDWKNSRSVMSYTPSTGSIDFYQTLSLSGMPSTSNGKHLTINTAHDNNGFGDGKTHIGYRTSSGYYHYFRGTGSMNINCTEGTNISGELNVQKGINMGAYEDGWRSLLIKRKINGGANFQAKFGASYNSIKQASSSTTTNVYGAVIEAHDTSNAVRRYLFGNNGFYPLSDNNSYCGSSSHRWQSIYASTGTVYSSSKDEKEDIKPLNIATIKNKQDSLVNIIVQGLKDISLYTYKYKTLNTDDQFVGFLGQELEEKNPEFFNLIGSSYEKEIIEPFIEGENDINFTIEGQDEEKEIKTVKQYDIREVSVNGVLMVGLQQALLEIDSLKAEIQELKGEKSNEL